MVRIFKSVRNCSGLKDKNVNNLGLGVGGRERCKGAEFSFTLSILGYIEDFSKTYCGILSLIP